VKFLIDNALSPALADLLRAAGHVARHVRDIDMQHGSDEAIFDYAEAEDLVLVSADTDFAVILARRAVVAPSVILFRGRGSRRPEALASVILANASQLAEPLEAGSIVTFEPSRLRIRGLPILGATSKEP
jgi:predicted nuclease of predicted toxin-antitoxin system